MCVRLTRWRGSEMKYEACYVNSLQFLTIMLYRTLNDYYKDRPATIYIITPVRKRKLALNRARVIERKYPHAEVKVLYEGKDKEKIETILDKCINARKVESLTLP
jgi:hypothetical protein